MKSKHILLASLFILASFFILGLTACGSKTSNDQAIHTHADGTVHEGRTHDEAATKQESFKVEADSTLAVVAADTAKHEHEHCDGHGHKH